MGWCANTRSALGLLLTWHHLPSFIPLFLALSLHLNLRLLKTPQWCTLSQRSDEIRLHEYNSKLSCAHFNVLCQLCILFQNRAVNLCKNINKFKKNSSCQSRGSPPWEQYLFRGLDDSLRISRRWCFFLFLLWLLWSSDLSTLLLKDSPVWELYYNFLSIDSFLTFLQWLN